MDFFSSLFKCRTCFMTLFTAWIFSSTSEELAAAMLLAPRAFKAWSKLLSKWDLWVSKSACVLVWMPFATVMEKALSLMCSSISALQLCSFARSASALAEAVCMAASACSTGLWGSAPALACWADFSSSPCAGAGVSANTNGAAAAAGAGCSAFSSAALFACLKASRAECKRSRMECKALRCSFSASSIILSRWCSTWPCCLSMRPSVRSAAPSARCCRDSLVRSPWCSLPS
mmetsp:Transcript_40722/g.92516  ORF Transcript_40722/g.92516 Transcript_40722/m.92516 type:complete len:232 (+) Transcript_40722:143-838(+)